MQMNRKDDKNDSASGAEQESEQGRQDSEEEVNADETDADDTKRFERSDNLRRRSDWFQKRTGGR